MPGDNLPVQIRPAHWDDLDAVVELLDARSRAVLGRSDWTAVSLRVHWVERGFEVGRDNWVAAANGRLVGYGAVSERQYVLVATLDPETGDALLERALARARERGFPALRVMFSPADTGLIELLARHGFEREAVAVRMWKLLDGDAAEPELPSGIAIRTYEAGDAGEVKHLLDEAYAGWDANYTPVDAETWRRLMTDDSEFDPGVWFLAEEEGELVGCALHWRGGWLKDIAVRDSHRGRGVAKALLLHGFAELAQRGVPRVGLKVDAANPTSAIPLYERLGFVEDQREEVHVRWL